MYVCNKERYGYLNVPGKPHFTLEDDRLNFVHVHLESLSKKPSTRLLSDKCFTSLKPLSYQPHLHDFCCFLAFPLQTQIWSLFGS